MEVGGYHFSHSQASSSEAGYGFPLPPASYNGENHESYSYPAPPRSDMANLDLNANVDSYTGLMQSGDGLLQFGGGLGRSSRSTFLPPRQIGVQAPQGVRMPGRAGGGTGGGAGGGAGRGNGGARRPGGAPRRAVSTPGSSTRRRKVPPMPARNQRSAGLDDEEAEENVDDNSSNGFDKACWTNDYNIHVFCELALEQMSAGNCPNLQLKSYAVKEIAQRFYDRTGLWLQHKQFRNMLSGCRTMYNWLKRHCRDTSDGRNARGGIEGLFTPDFRTRVLMTWRC